MNTDFTPLSPDTWNTLGESLSEYSGDDKTREVQPTSATNEAAEKLERALKEAEELKSRNVTLEHSKAKLEAQSKVSEAPKILTQSVFQINNVTKILDLELEMHRIASQILFDRMEKREQQIAREFQLATEKYTSAGGTQY
jgi:rRNA maturation endonuclease Nob1